MFGNMEETTSFLGKKDFSKKLLIFGRKLKIDYNKKNDNFKLNNNL